MCVLAFLALAGLGILLFPLVILTGAVLSVIVSLAFLILAIWLLGKIILFLWDVFKSKL